MEVHPASLDKEQLFFLGLGRANTPKKYYRRKGLEGATKITGGCVLVITDFR